MLLNSPSHVKQLCICTTAILLLFYLSLRWHYYSPWDALAWSRQVKVATQFHAHLDFWKALELLLKSNPPGILRPDQDGSAPPVLYNATHPTERPELIHMSEEDVEKMRKAHENYIYSIKVHAPKLIYKPNTRGVIATAGGSYLPVLVVSLRMLRRTGSTLPMEVFLASNREYESFICEHTLPSLNAKCVILSEILDNVVHEVEVAKYQLKAFAMLFSSFEEILFLDADSFPVSDPRHLFTSEPFKSSKLITWPDFWATSISGYYHRISNTPAIDTTVRATSEAGEVLISKRTHARTLLLATYYNYYGPHHYYPLLSQGGPGEGDKETFLYAAIALKEPFYDTSEKVLAIGHQYDWGLAGSAMVQYDPVADYALTSQKLFRNIDPACATSPRPLFVHVNFPKFNPGHIFDDRLLLEYAGNGTVRRVWTDEKETMAGFGGDVEKGYWEEIGWVACTLEGKFMDWVESGDVCVKARKYWTDLFGGVAPY